LHNVPATPPTPPPPGVAALKEPAAGEKVLSMREQMAAHSQQKNCHSCHGVMDPMGLALENFDATGRWREKDRLAGTRIDASGVLPDGTEVTGPTDLRQIGRASCRGRGQGEVGASGWIKDRRDR